MSDVYMIIGFLLAGHAVVANDAIQTLGTFLSSNARRPWWLLWLFVGGVLVAVMLYGYVRRNGDLSYGRLTRIPETGVFAGWMLAPPLVIPGLTRFGIPVSTTFLILTAFNPRGLDSMLAESLLGYAVAFAVGYLVYTFAMRAAERHFIETSRGWSSTRWSSRWRKPQTA